MPESTWRDVKSKEVSLVSSAYNIARVAISINLINPDQPTLFRMVSILAYGEGNYDFSQDDVFKYMDKAQNFVKDGRSDKDLPYLEQYPASAKDLPQGLKAAYGDTMPVDVEIPDLESILAGMKQRGRRKSATPVWL